MSILASARQAGPSALISTVSRSVGLGPVQPWLPAGETLGARLFRHGLEPGTGVEWIDETGVGDAQVRLSYAATLTGNAVAVTSLALRLDNPDGSVGDLFLRAPARGSRRTARERMLVAATPYLVAGGRLLSLGARQCGAETFELCCARGDGEWRGFADLRISPRPHGGRPLHPDPLANVLPGLEAGIPAPRAG
ncbi:hypothetical protein [Nocardioides koreensis]